MKLLTLEINDFRGIRNLTISPNGDNLVIIGPNGSGKSAVVDAIDFILSGNITRLSGEGTGGIRLGDYGSHIMAPNENSWVSGVFQIPRSEEPVSLKRSVLNPSQLICEPASSRPFFDTIADYAKLGQHIVTRREIMRFIISRPQERAETISSLLDMSLLEESRETTVRVRGIFNRKAEGYRSAIQSSVSQIVSTSEMEEYDESELIKEINILRGKFSASQIDNIASSIADDIENPISEAIERPSEITNLDETVTGIKDVLGDESLAIISETEEKLSESLKMAQSVEDFKRVLLTRKLVSLGLKLVDDSKSCPLCDLEWDLKSLRTHLEEKTEKSTKAKVTADEIDKFAGGLKEIVEGLITKLRDILFVTSLINLDTESLRLGPWLSTLEQFLTSLENPIDDYQGNSKDVARLFTTGVEVDEIGLIHDKATEAYPDPSEIQSRWKKLVQLQENVAAFLKDTDDEKKAKEYHELAKKVVTHFENAIKFVLDSLYNDISQQFAVMYKTLHGPDESNFGATLVRDGAGLKILTEFHDQGAHPPLALHSEGHQDSMGLAIHLALRERITAGMLSLAVLDDVIMSIDGSHRKNVCKLLFDLSGNNQFIITTHDKAWSKYLCSEGVVKKQNLVEFYNWSLEAGPRINVGLDMWDKTIEYLDNDNNVEAVGLLRNGLEQFFEDMCDALEAKTTYRSNRLYTLGDYLPAAHSRLLKLLKRAAKAEEKIENADRAASILKHIDEIGKAYKSTEAEFWTINRTLHYSTWANLTSSELKEHVETFKRYCELFLCPKCKTGLFLTKKDGKSIGIRCVCGSINLALSD
ncbi:MAG: AAA family ATPase [Candidatus Thorarchaeota archaeon]|jgi:energy-coupling factor transporter ATP-binding protein EcfA2